MIVSRNLSPELIRNIAEFRERILADPAEVLDPPDIHHQFASLVNHGRKLDMDKIETGTEFFGEWTTVYADWVNEVYRGRKPDALLGIANGANRLAIKMAPMLGAVGLETIKINSKSVGLSENSRFAIEDSKPHFVLLVEDVGTTGGTTSTVIPELRELGVDRIEVAHTWVRNPILKVLEEQRIPYGAMIHEPLPTFSEEDCRNLPEGFCHQGVKLIPHGESS